MNNGLHDSSLLNPSSPEELETVRVQLERLLASSHFRNSKRYPTLLRYIVEEALEGRGPGLKERTLGVEVFGRAPEYDTSSDPIVRVTVAEIRKRIAQYYHEDAHISELRIELKPGSYVPEFLHGREPEEFLEERPAPFDAVPLSPVTILTEVEPPNAVVLTQAPRRLRRAHLRLWMGLAALLLLICGVAAFLIWGRTSAMDALWAPVLSVKGPVTFCLPVSVQRNGKGSAETTEEAISHALDLKDKTLPASGTFFDHQLLGENVVYSDVTAMMKLDAVAAQQGRPVRVRLNLGTNLDELREGPVIFLGGLSNQWTLQLLEPLRYRFGGNDDDAYYIRDAKNPGDKQWSVRLHDKMSTVSRDYAIVARTRSEALGQPVMIAAGVGMSGTAAAGEFLANPAQVAELRKRMGSKLRDHDFEAVLQTDVVNGIAGPAKIVALEVR